MYKSLAIILAVTVAIDAFSLESISKSVLNRVRSKEISSEEFDITERTGNLFNMLRSDKSMIEEPKLIKRFATAERLETAVERNDEHEMNHCIASFEHAVDHVEHGTMECHDLLHELESNVKSRDVVMTRKVAERLTMLLEHVERLEVIDRLVESIDNRNEREIGETIRSMEEAVERLIRGGSRFSEEVRMLMKMIKGETENRETVQLRRHCERLAEVIEMSEFDRYETAERLVVAVERHDMKETNFFVRRIEEAIERMEHRESIHFREAVELFRALRVHIEHRDIMEIRRISERLCDLIESHENTITINDRHMDLTERLAWAVEHRDEHEIREILNMMEELCNRVNMRECFDLLRELHMVIERRDMDNIMHICERLCILFDMNLDNERDHIDVNFNFMDRIEEAFRRRDFVEVWNLYRRIKMDVTHIFYRYTVETREHLNNMWEAIERRDENECLTIVHRLVSMIEYHMDRDEHHFDYINRITEAFHTRNFHEIEEIARRLDEELTTLFTRYGLRLREYILRLWEAIHDRDMDTITRVCRVLCDIIRTHGHELTSKRITDSFDYMSHFEDAIRERNYRECETMARRLEEEVTYLFFRYSFELREYIERMWDCIERHDDRELLRIVRMLVHVIESHRHNHVELPKNLEMRLEEVMMNVVQGRDARHIEHLVDAVEHRDINKVRDLLRVLEETVVRLERRDDRDARVVRDLLKMLKEVVDRRDLVEVRRIGERLTMILDMSVKRIEMGQNFETAMINRDEFKINEIIRHLEEMVEITFNRIESRDAVEARKMLRTIKESVARNDIREARVSIELLNELISHVNYDNVMGNNRMMSLSDIVSNIVDLI